MDGKDAKQLGWAVAKMIIGAGSVGALLFGSAGTFAYWNAWLMMVLLFVPMLIVGVVLWLKAKDLLRKRLVGKEKESEQKQVVLAFAGMFIAGFVLAGLDFRLGWSEVPCWGIAIACCAHLARHVAVQEGQKVVDTGLYGFVRHPMYLAMCVLYLCFPIVVGSWIALIAFLPTPFLLAKRIRNEEAVLEKGLAGYSDYKKKVKYRLIPFVW